MWIKLINSDEKCGGKAQESSTINIMLSGPVVTFDALFRIWNINCYVKKKNEQI